MAIAIIMPRQGQSVESCIITKWHVEKGDKVEEGDLLFTYETDKATFEEESEQSGLILDIFFEEGDDVPVLTNVCVIGEEGEDSKAFSPHEEDEALEETLESDNKKDSQEGDLADKPISSMDSSLKSADSDDILKISPRARNLAERRGVKLEGLIGTGPEGRIIERDIEAQIIKGDVFTSAAFEASKGLGADLSMDGMGLGGAIRLEDMDGRDEQEQISPSRELVSTELSEADFEDVNLTNIRKVIAKTMHESLQNSAQLTLNSSFDATDILEFRKKLKADKSELGLSGITLNDILLYALARTLTKHKELNAHFLGDSIRLFKAVNLGVAIDTPRGLMVPTLFNADKMSLLEISKEVKLLASACLSGTINPDLLTGGSFTMTNLGNLGIESFTPVLNPPQTGILGVNNINYKIRDKDGSMEHYPAMGLSLTFDHRAIDGAPAARFLQDLVNSLENFTLLLSL